MKTIFTMPQLAMWLDEYGCPQHITSVYAYTDDSCTDTYLAYQYRAYRRRRK